MFIATDFHGGPFRGHKQSHHNSNNNNNNAREDHLAAAFASTSQSGCDVSLGSMSLAPTERGTTASGAAAVAVASDGVGEGPPERPWFCQHVMTAG